MENYAYINPETNEAYCWNSDGEIVSNGRYIPEEDDRKEQKKREAFKKKQIDLTEGRLERHIGCFQKNIRDIVPSLSLTDCGFLITILAKMKLKADGLLISENKPMTATSIQKYIGKSRSQTSDYLKKFTKLGVLIEVKNGRKKHYRVNSQYHIMGEHHNNTKDTWFIKLYKSKLYEMIDILSFREIGFIYKALPICHYNMFYLVHNPNSSYNLSTEQLNYSENYCNNELNFFNRKELGEYMNENVDNISKIVKSLCEKGLLMTSYSSGVVSYRLHPHIVYPKGTKVNTRIQCICNDFEAHKSEALRRKKQN